MQILPILTVDGIAFIAFSAIVRKIATVPQDNKCIVASAELRIYFHISVANRAEI